jgi:CheY-like chemotaxis protein
MTEAYCFVLIDDVAMNNLLSKYIVKNSYPAAQIVEFTDPLLALQYIQDHCQDNGAPLNIILLDVYMPVVDGWDFLDSYERLPDEVKSKCAVYVLSSSINKADADRANANKNVVGYALKPLTENILVGIVNKIIEVRKMQ